MSIEARRTRLHEKSREIGYYLIPCTLHGGSTVQSNVYLPYSILTPHRKEIDSTAHQHTLTAQPHNSSAESSN